MALEQPARTVCKAWASTEEIKQLPSESFLTAYMMMLSLSALILMATIKSLRPHALRKVLSDAGVALHKVAKTAQELERKSFHLAGLLVPLIYQVLLQHGYSRRFCVQLVWSITISGIAMDLARVHIPVVARNWPLKGILRESEATQLCGGSYFSLGCTLAIHGFEPVVAMTSIIFLVLGDMSAALMGRSFGQSICNIKIGREGRKSVEGSVAMFVVCLLFGCSIFSQVHLREYAVTLAALVATLAELYEPFGINDNVTIPVLSSMALHFGFGRTYSCDPTRSPLLWYAESSG
jgi:dolichol kinase